MRIFSYNVNGLRAAIGKGFWNWLEKEQPDMIGLQEIKANPDQVGLLELEALGYHSYWFPAKKPGYSGTALFSKIPAKKVVMGMNQGAYDDEGRVLIADFDDFTMLTAYFPSGTTGDVRQDFKMKFLEDFLKFSDSLQQQKKKLLICGDFNICHKPIDINHPNKHTRMSGFLPEEREWMDRFTTSGFTDTFRVFNQESEQYSWWSYRANSRAKNLGWRIDYHMTSPGLTPHLSAASILKEVSFSDHCPVAVELKL
ncbi:MAG: exodeoxyribonuclease III [Bacteroidales bacterium]